MPTALPAGHYHISGYYVQEVPTATHMNVLVDGSSITGQGSDMLGAFKIQGEWRERDNSVAVVFEKTYAGEEYSVEYKGKLEGGRRLVGTWSIPGDASDTFALWLEPADAHSSVLESATWSGHCLAHSNRMPMVTGLSFYASGLIEGSGRDAAGEFTICGRFVDDTAVATGQFVFAKRYGPTHKVSYEGVRNGAVMKGTHQTADSAIETFELRKDASHDPI